MSEFRPEDFPLATFLGMRYGPVAAGAGRAEIEILPQHLNPHGFVHGGVVFTLIDTLMGAAAMSLVAPGERVATVDLHIRFHRGVSGGVLSAEAKTLHRSGSTITMAAEAANGDGDPVASATASFRVLRPPA
jgi:acyl-CoA thioesterase